MNKNLNRLIIQMRTDNQQIFWAKQTAKRLFKKYNYQGNELQQYELSSLLGQTYQHLNIPFKSNTNDVKSFARVLDQNRDGKVTLDDLEAVCIRYLCGDGITISNTSYQTNSYQQPQQYQPQSFTSITTQQKKAAPPQSYQLQSYQTQPIQQTYANKKTQTNSSTTNYNIQSSYNQSSYQNYQQNNSYESSKQYSTPLQTINNEGLLSHQLTRGGSKEIFDQYSQQNNEYPQDYPQRSLYGNSVRQSYTQSQKQEYTLSNQNVLGSQPQTYVVEQQPSYTEQVLRYLEIARNIFFSYCLPDQTITEREVPIVLSETYQALGRSGYVPTQEDVKVWMRLCDGDQDGHVQYEQYEYFVVRSLERSGVNIYEDVAV